jgi:hypothetical protein
LERRPIRKRSAASKQNAPTNIAGEAPPLASFCRTVINDGRALTTGAYPMWPRKKNAESAVRSPHTNSLEALSDIDLVGVAVHSTIILYAT